MTIRTKHEPINEVLRQYEQEEQPFRKVHRLIDLFETIIKMHSVYLVSYYLRTKQPSNEIKGFLSYSLRIPSLGVWQLISRVFCDELLLNDISEREWAKFHSTLSKEESENVKKIYKWDGSFYKIREGMSRKELSKKSLQNLLEIREDTFTNQPYYIDGFMSYFYQWDKKVDEVIHLRNGYAHGATPSDLECQQNIETFEPVLKDWLQSSWFHQTSVCVFKEDRVATATKKADFIKPLSGETYSDFDVPFLEINGYYLNLFPILTYKSSGNTAEESFYFFNDLKKYKSSKRISYLNYPFAENLLDKDIYERFLKIIDLENWKNPIPDQFRERIEELTESFKGRELELKQIYHWAETVSKGFLVLQGPPGIGKSAISANLQFDTKKYNQISYFFKRATEHSNPNNFLDYLHRQVGRLYDIQISDKNMDKQSLLVEKLRGISHHSDHKKLVLIIDGIDELDETLHHFLPNEAMKNLLVIYTSRITKKTSEFYASISTEHIKTFDLSGLNSEDIRALLYESVNKYQLEQSYVDKIFVKSQGNPLYVKLLCDALQQQELSLNDTNQLPGQIADFYKRIITRFSKKKLGNSILQILFTLAAAKDYLTKFQLEKMTSLSLSEIEESFETLEEILVQNSLNEGYQLFHDSFRDFLLKKYEGNVREAERSIITYCSRWNQQTSDRLLQSYTFRYYANHLYNQNEYRTIYELCKNQSFIEEQIHHTKQYLYTFQLLQFVMILSAKQKNHQAFIDLCIRATDLHTRMNGAYQVVLEDISQGGMEHVLLAIEKMRILGVREKATLFAYLLYQVVKDKVPLIQENQHIELIEQIEQALSDENFVWNEYVNVNLLIHIMNQLHSKQISFEFMMNRISLQRFARRGELSDFIDSILGDVEHLLLGKKIFERMDDDEYKVLAFKDIARKLIRAGKPYLATRIFNETDVGKLNPSLTDLIIRELVAVEEFELAQKYAEKMKSGRYPFYYAEHLSMRGFIQESLLMVDLTPNQRKTFYEHALEYLIAHNRVEDAFKLIKENDQMFKDPELKEDLLKKIIEMKNPFLAEALIYDLPPAFKYYFQLEKLFIEKKDMDQATIYREKMKQMLKELLIRFDGERNEFVKQELLKSIGEAFVYLKQFEEAILFVNRQTKGMNKDNVMCRLAILSSELYTVSDAEKFIPFIESVPKKDTFYMNAGLILLVRKEADECLRVSNLASDGLKRDLREQIARYYIKVGELEKGVVMFPSSSNLRSKKSFLTSVIKKLKGKEQEAIKIVRHFLQESSGKNRGEEKEIQKLLLGLLADTKRYEEAFRLQLQIMDDEINVKEKIQFSDKNVLSLCRQLYKKNEFPELFEIISKFNPAKQISLLCIQWGNPIHPDYLKQAMQKAKDVCFTIPSPDAKVDGYFKIIGFLKKNNEKQMIYETLELIKGQVNSVESIFFRKVLIPQILVLYAEIGRIEESLVYISKDQSFDFRIDSILNVVESVPESLMEKKIELLEKSYELISNQTSNSEIDLDTITQLIKLLVELRMNQKALELMIEHYDEYQKPFYRTRFQSIVEAAVKHDNPHFLQQLSEWVMEPNDQRIIDFYKGIYKFKRGLKQEGLKALIVFFNEYQGENKHLELESSLTQLLQELIKTGDFKTFIDLIDIIPTRSIKCEGYIELSAHYFGQGNMALGNEFVEKFFKHIFHLSDKEQYASFIKLLEMLSAYEKVIMDVLSKCEKQKYFSSLIEYVLLRSEGLLFSHCLSIMRNKLTKKESAAILDSLLSEGYKNDLMQELSPFILVPTVLESYLESYAIHTFLSRKDTDSVLSEIGKVIDTTIFDINRTESVKFLSTNLDEWIHIIEDESDRMEIKAFAQSVRKGKMKEETFRELIETYMKEESDGRVSPPLK